MVARGIQTADILRGIHVSIGARLVELAAEAQQEKRRTLVGTVTLETHSDGMVAGALGAFRFEQLERRGQRMPHVTRR